MWGIGQKTRGGVKRRESSFATGVDRSISYKRISTYPTPGQYPLLPLVLHLYTLLSTPQPTLILQQQAPSPCLVAHPSSPSHKQTKSQQPIASILLNDKRFVSKRRKRKEKKRDKKKVHRLFFRRSTYLLEPFIRIFTLGLIIREERINRRRNTTPLKGKNSIGKRISNKMSPIATATQQQQRQQSKTRSLSTSTITTTIMSHYNNLSSINNTIVVVESNSIEMIIVLAGDGKSSL